MDFFLLLLLVVVEERSCSSRYDSGRLTDKERKERQEQSGWIKDSIVAHVSVYWYIVLLIQVEVSEKGFQWLYFCCSNVDKYSVYIP